MSRRSADYKSAIRQSATLRSPGGRFENSPPFQGWVRKDGAPSPEGTVELFPQVTFVVSNFVLLQQGDKLLLKTHLPVMLLLALTGQRIQPSLRDLFNRNLGPTLERALERVGYSRFSLREILIRHFSAPKNVQTPGAALPRNLHCATSRHGSAARPKRVHEP